MLVCDLQTMLFNDWTWVYKDISKSQFFLNEHKLIEQAQNFKPQGGETFSQDSCWSVLMTPIHPPLVFLTTSGQDIALNSIQFLSK